VRDLGPPAKTVAGCRRTRQRAARYLVPPLIGHRPRVPCVTRWLATTPKINARVRAALGPAGGRTEGDLRVSVAGRVERPCRGLGARRPSATPVLWRTPPARSGAASGRATGREPGA